MSAVGRLDTMLFGNHVVLTHQAATRLRLHTIPTERKAASCLNAGSYCQAG